jgi:hypothetical protein
MRSIEKYSPCILFFLLIPFLALHLILSPCVVAFVPMPMPMPRSSSSASSPTSVILESSNPSTTPPTASTTQGKRIGMMAATKGTAGSDGNANANTSSSSSSSDLQTNPRTWILQVGVSAGRLCGVANSHLLYHANSSNTTEKNTVLVLAMTELLLDLFHTSQSLQLDLILSIRRKMALNNRKYPVELCKVCTNCLSPRRLCRVM